MRLVPLSFVKNRRGRCLVSALIIMALVVSSFVLPVHISKSSPAESTSSYGLSNPTISNGVTTWDCIYFGNYYQSNSSTKEPIKWRVLSVNGNDAFLLADQNLDAKPYNEKYTDVTWATCTLRTWLNDTFLNTAFKSAEQAASPTSVLPSYAPTPSTSRFFRSSQSALLHSGRYKSAKASCVNTRVT